MKCPYCGSYDLRCERVVSTFHDLYSCNSCHRDIIVFVGFLGMFKTVVEGQNMEGENGRKTKD